MTRVRMILAAVAAVLMVGGSAAAATATLLASGPPTLSSPPGTVGPFYSGPVHECVAASDESVAYFELHSTTTGNCAAGYRQLTVNELTPVFTLQLGTGAAYQCSAATSQAETAITCTPPASPSPSASSSPTSG